MQDLEKYTFGQFRPSLLLKKISLGWNEGQISLMLSFNLMLSRIYRLFQWLDVGNM